MARTTDKICRQLFTNYVVVKVTHFFSVYFFDKYTYFFYCNVPILFQLQVFTSLHPIDRALFFSVGSMKINVSFGLGMCGGLKY